MNLVKSLTISVFSLFFVAAYGQDAQRGCIEIEVNATITPTSLNSANGIISLTFRDSSEYEVFLLGQERSKNRLGIRQNIIENLPAGNYDLIITDVKRRNVCPRHLKIEVL